MSATSSGVAAWVPIVTFVGGSAVTLAVEYIRSITARADRRQAAAEAKAERDAAADTRREERTQRLADEHRARQRDTLRELQERLSDFIRAVGQGHHADEMAWAAAGPEAECQPVGQNAPGISDEVNTQQRRMMTLAQRVEDDEVRELIREIIAAASELTLAGRDAANSTMLRLARDFQRANDRIGVQLRAIPQD
jgi:hypothetical protein